MQEIVVQFERVHQRFTEIDDRTRKLKAGQNKQLILLETLAARSAEHKAEESSNAVMDGLTGICPIPYHWTSILVRPLFSPLTVVPIRPVTTHDVLLQAIASVQKG